MIDNVTKNAAPQALELNTGPSEEVILAILNYSKSVEPIEIDNQKILLNFN